MAVGSAAVIGAGATLVGDWMSQQGQTAANQAQMDIAEANNREMTYLASNAMQLRVEDLKRAGLNPMLAVGTQGAVVPNLQQPNLQNPNAAYGQLGPQISNALQLASLKSQIRDTNASAGYKEAMTPSDDVLPVDDQGHVDIQSILTSPHGGMLGKMNVATAMANVDQINATVDNIKSQTDVNKITQQLRSVDLSVAKGTVQALITKAANDAALGSADVSIEQARAKILGGPAGPWIQAAESVLGGGFVGNMLGSVLSKMMPGKVPTGGPAVQTGQTVTSYGPTGRVTGSQSTQYHR